MGESTGSANSSNETQSQFDFAVMEQKLTLAKEIFRTFVIGIGLILNCVVLSVVILSRQLRYPRHIFWAAIAFFECFILIEYSLELFVIINQNELACRALVLMSSVDYSLLLLCLSMTAFDRYLSIVRYDWYQVNVTNRDVVGSISIASSVSVIIISIPFWTGYKSIYDCSVSLIHNYWIAVWNLLLGIVCIVLQFNIFINTRTLIRQYVPTYRREPIRIKFTNPSIQPSNVSFGSEAETTKATENVFIEFSENPSDAGHVRQHPADEESQLVSSIDHKIGKENFPWRQNCSKYNRLEIQAALNMSVNIIPFWLCTFPVSCNAIALYWCIRLEGNCDTIVLIWTYAWDVFMLHGVYNPILYMSTSPEFRRAVNHLTRKLIKKCRDLMACYRN